MKAQELFEAKNVLNSRNHNCRFDYFVHKILTFALQNLITKNNDVFDFNFKVKIFGIKFVNPLLIFKSAKFLIKLTKEIATCINQTKKL